MTLSEEAIGLSSELLFFTSRRNKNATVGTAPVKPTCHCGHLFSEHSAYGCQWCGCREAR